MIDVGKLLCPAPKGVCYFVGDQLLHGLSLFGVAELAHLLWSPAPTGIFPNEWLVIVWCGALVPMLMVLLWVWTNNLSQTGRNNFVLLSSTKHRLL